MGKGVGREREGREEEGKRRERREREKGGGGGEFTVLNPQDASPPYRHTPLAFSPSPPPMTFSHSFGNR